MQPDSNRKKKKKVDYEALHSRLMQVPGMKVAAVRALLNIGITEVYELSGRSPEVLFHEALKKAPETESDVFAFIQMAVYYAENSDPEPSKMRVQFWR
ncbi:MAG: hypothetical protein AAGJ81_07455 [Verrucomicrobiota bacterium]